MHAFEVRSFAGLATSALSSRPSSLKSKPTRMEELRITKPDDWHLHLRDGDLLQAVAPHSASQFGRAIVMPNLKPPVTTTAAAVAYRESILRALPPDCGFDPLMTLYLTDNTSPQEIELARRSGVVYAVKLYPAGATTNSQDGVTDIFGKCLPVLEQMIEHSMPLLVHGEVTDPNVDTFDREKVFIETILEPLVRRLPQLKIVMEHITTLDAVNFVESCTEGSVAATVTPQHLLLNRNSLFQGGLQPHNYCLPVLKRETHSYFLNPRFQYSGNATVDNEVLSGFKHVVERMEPDVMKQLDIHKEVELYRMKLGVFYSEKARIAATKYTPGQAIVAAVTSGSRRFFLGTDSAPHERRRKECSCGCAGIYSAPVALSLYAKVFEEAGALDKLEAFTSFNGPDFYDLPRNISKVVLKKSSWRVPKSYKFASGEIIPMFAGQTLDWLPSAVE